MHKQVRLADLGTTQSWFMSRFQSNICTLRCEKIQINIFRTCLSHELNRSNSWENTWVVNWFDSFPGKLLESQVEYYLFSTEWAETVMEFVLERSFGYKWDQSDFIHACSSEMNHGYIQNHMFFGWVIGWFESSFGKTTWVISWIASIP